MRSKPASRDAGFALIELIAVLALSALVLLTLLIAADLVTRNSAAAARRANDIEALATGFSALRRDVAGAKHIAVGGAERKLLFHGSATALGITVEGGGDAGTGDNLIWISTQEGNDRRLLVRSETPLLPQMADFATAEFTDPAVLMAGPWNYAFSYGRSSSGAALTWMATWSDPRTLPTAVRLEVTDRNGTRVLSPLVVPVHVDAGPGCPDGPAACEGDVSGAEPVAGEPVGSGEGNGSSAPQ